MVFCSNFPPLVPSGVSGSASNKNPEQQRGQEQPLALRPHFPSVPLRDKNSLFLEFLPSSHVPRRPAGLSSAHARENRNISAGPDCFQSKNAQMRCDTKNWAAKKGTNFLQVQHSSLPWLGCSPLLSAASKGCKSQVWRACSAN